MTLSLPRQLPRTIYLLIHRWPRMAADIACVCAASRDDGHHLPPEEGGGDRRKPPSQSLRRRQRAFLLQRLRVSLRFLIGEAALEQRKILSSSSLSSLPSAWSRPNPSLVPRAEANLTAIFVQYGRPKEGETVFSPLASLPRAPDGAARSSGRLALSSQRTSFDRRSIETSRERACVRVRVCALAKIRNVGETYTCVAVYPYTREATNWMSLESELNFESGEVKGSLRKSSPLCSSEGWGGLRS